jgi:glycosyltransferase involved in cell wall biosynthesis
MKEIIFVGWVNKGRLPVDGETTKNQYIIAELEKYCKVHVLDFYQKNKHPWIYLQALWAFIRYPQATIILSTSAQNVYAMLKRFKKLGVKREIIHWVIGGNFGELVQKGRYDADVFNYVKYNLVQCKGMIIDLETAGVKNARFVSNFKPINYFPDLEKCQKVRDNCGKMRFVFLSRIMVDKGCDYILAAASLLNNQGYRDRYTIDFYGKVDPMYKNVFERAISSLDNVKYHGLLDLKTKEGYDELATYHAMLFPSYWRGEGFAGVFIDAFIAALPVLSSDWAHNAECIINGKTGVLYPTHNVEALRQVMEDCINGKVDINKMSINARFEVSKYQADKVITEEYVRNLGLME